MTSELLKRLISSIALTVIFLFCFFVNNYAFLFILFIAFLICWIEWISIIIKTNFKNRIFNKLSYFLSILYLFVAGNIMFEAYLSNKILFLALLSTCIFSDIGGYIIGKTFAGKKLTKISPNKTISGSIGSFLFSIVPFIFYVIFYINADLNAKLIFLPILFSFICQLGDLFISFLKRKAKVKDTGDILPGHGGLLDRIDGMILAIPLGMFIWEFLVVII